MSTVPKNLQIPESQARNVRIAGMARFFRPRFSFRTLAIFVTLACVYFGAWRFTSKQAFKIHQSTDFSIERCYSPGPFVVIQHELTGTLDGVDVANSLVSSSPARPVRVYLWLLGPKIRLPIEWGRPRPVWKQIDGKWQVSS